MSIAVRPVFVKKNGMKDTIACHLPHQLTWCIACAPCYSLGFPTIGILRFRRDVNEEVSEIHDPARSPLDINLDRAANKIKQFQQELLPGLHMKVDKELSVSTREITIWWEKRGERRKGSEHPNFRG